MAEKEKLRIDKYLWAIRVFKTRTLASDACKAGRIKLDGKNIKPSYEVKIGDVYQVAKGIERKVVKVTGLLENRVDAKTAVNFYEDITPVEQTQAFKSMFHAPILKRDRGTGRPTKADRREIDDLWQSRFKSCKFEALYLY
ncbi:RNA-binding S4 domain-containing protein, partial [Mucilaginibacter sp. Mucisp84]|uniref:RNA-binding S4 domain-containing protein n=1 Tax=Mucilaginibacter sp. Mucisp84 TaxID=3243058 RepID=UPI0039A6CC06